MLALALCVLLFAGAVHGLPSWLAGLQAAGGGLCPGAVFVGSATLINRIAPPANTRGCSPLFYVIAYVANWVPVLLGWVSDGAGLGVALDLLFVGSTLTNLAGVGGVSAALRPAV